MPRNIGVWVSLCVGVLAVIIGWAVIPIVVRSKIAENVALRPNTEAWDRWQNLPVQIQFRVFVFNITNPHEILDGKTPVVEEIGPYVYREKRIKTIKLIDEKNSKVVYEQKLVFEFDVNASAPYTEDDILRVANVPAVLFGQVVDNLKSISSVIRLYDTALEKIWPTDDKNPLFVNVKVKDYLFNGIPIRCNQRITPSNVDTAILCEAFKILHPRTTLLNDLGDGIHSFAFFKYKNKTIDGLYEIDLGINDVTKIGKILSWNNVTLLSIWKGDSCNEILGTDATVFRPYLGEDSVESLYIYHTDVCRSIKLAYEDETEFKGVKGRRYVTDKSFFASVLNDSDNHCFCPQSVKGITHYGGCLRSGLLELSGCQGVPAIASYPHFFMADPIYQNKVEGLQPDKDKHMIFLDLEPNTGYPLRASSRVQVSVLLKKMPQVKLMQNLPNVLLPAIWLEEKVELSDELIDLINSQLLNVLGVVNIVKWVVIAIGIIMSISSLVYYILKTKRCSISKRQKVI